MNMRMPKYFRRTNLRYADQLAVVESLLEAKKFFLKNDWLLKNNRYRKNTTKRLKKDFNASIRQKHLRTYIGISSIIHCYDGWQYLGRAVSSAIHFDFTTARHLAYYAELRAAISILSSNGIAVFRDRHIILGKAKLYKYTGQQTHPMTWKALNYFANQRKTASSLLKVISPNQHSLYEWLGALGINTYRETVGKDWLEAWGLDIKRFSLDHDARNYLSYRPSQINEKNSIDLKNLLGLINGIWESSEFPTFKNIDVQLLKWSLVKGFKLKTSHSAIDNLNEYQKEIRILLQSLAPAGYSYEYWFNYLTDLTDDSFLIKEACGTANLFESNHYIQMICRAFLLLRVASGYTKQNLERAGITGEELKFWWLPLIMHLGYTNSEIELSELNDVLFTDIQTSKEKLNSFTEDPKFFTDTYSWCNNYNEEKDRLSQLERIGIIAIAS